MDSQTCPYMQFLLSLPTLFPKYLNISITSLLHQKFVVKILYKQNISVSVCSEIPKLYIAEAE